MDPITTSLKELVTALNGLAIGGVSIAFLALASIGGLAMALVQTLKELTPLRRAYQFRHVYAWLETRWPFVTLSDANARSSNADSPPPPVNRTPHGVLGDWVDLAVGGNAFALFSPPSEQMSAYMKQAIPVMLDEAVRYHDLIAVLAWGVSTEDFKMVLDGPTAETRSEYFDARARVTRRIERSIEGLEVDISTRWKFWMQVSSLLVTAAVVEASVIASSAPSPLTYIIAIPMGLLGGYFAPVLRDLVAALQKLRQA